MVLIGNINLTEHKPKLKMGGFISINVDVISNPFCAAMRNSDTICKFCYAYYMSTRYPRLKRALLHNYNVLSNGLLSADQIEKIGDHIVEHSIGLRFNSMGELINQTHAINLNLIAMYIKSREPSFPITIWSKRVILAGEIDNNYITKIYSNPEIDHPASYIPKGFNGIFNVCTHAYFKRTNNIPNCSGHCADCMKCYKPSNDNFVIYEMIKSDQQKIKRGKLEAI